MGQHRHTVNCCTVDAYAHGRDEERAVVVAWLRAQSISQRRWVAGQDEAAMTMSDVADAVERGDHLANPGEPF